jgi:hypothetical protein
MPRFPNMNVRIHYSGQNRIASGVQDGHSLGKNLIAANGNRLAVLHCNAALEELAFLAYSPVSNHKIRFHSNDLLMDETIDVRLPEDL